MATSKRTPGRKSPTGKLRLIGGRFGGRRLPIPDQPGLRPTAERTRETLFNWLQPVIAGSRCLDAFAGSGALGFEALSRGAAQVVMLERNAAVARQLQSNARTLAAENACIHAADSLHWLATVNPTPFDIVFLDPPFAEHLLPASLDALSTRPWLAAGARIYLETDAREPFPNLPSGWSWLREKTAGQVRFGLALAGVAD
ncbi:16S rRNA (guanine(966)-N(2))-methyltransferase RsmD [Thiorhodovibrio frisius]|uniref:16S rRNA (guanine(966)-N(2))-methyltransferase RsmD n=1 Tax=Thiorhodovibrio frisius TaxID=631362 RepID=UPI000688F421